MAYETFGGVGDRKNDGAQFKDDSDFNFPPGTIEASPLPLQAVDGTRHALSLTGAVIKPVGTSACRTLPYVGMEKEKRRMKRHLPYWDPEY